MTIALAPDQEAAARAPEERVVVSAAPGSGKTRTIVARVQNMLEGDVPADSVAVVTFTRTAAKRLRDLIGKGPFIGTIHSLALDIIRRHGHTVGWSDPANIRVLSDDEEEIELRYIAESMSVKPSRKFFACIEAIANGTATGHADSTEHRIFELHRGLLRSGSYVSVRTIIREAMDVLAAGVVPHIRNVVLDEAQDTDLLQWSFLDMLAADSMFAVGDADQAIFAWRGARPDLFVARGKEPGCVLHRIGKTYRFGATLAAPANRLIVRNQQRFDGATIITDPRDGETAEIVLSARASDILCRVRAAILDHGPGGVAILSRTHAALSSIGAVLSAEGIPNVHVRPPGDITKTGEFRLLMSAVRLAVDPNDKRAGTVLDMAMGQGTHAGRLGRSIETCHAYVSVAGGMDPERLMDANNRLVRLQWEQGLLFPEIPEHIAFGTPIDTTVGLDISVNLMTVHGAKGLEWPYVIVAGLNEHLWPSDAAAKRDMEEERRLAYVACTRAQRELVMASLDTIDFGLPHDFHRESPLLRELDGVP